MTDREEKLEAALREIDQWAKAYPLEMFPEVDLVEAQAVLEHANISMGAMHAKWARHIVSGIGSIAAAALETGK
jgi:hypothetical protein